MGAKDSKPSFISYEDAVKRVSDSELRRIREAFKRCAGANGTALSLEAFVHEVLCDGVPYEVAEWLYQACGGTKRGIAFRELLCGIVVLTKGNIEEKIKFLWTLYTNNQGENGMYIYKRDFTRTLHMENNSLPVTGAARSAEILLSLFGPGDRVTFDQFRSWLLIHKDATVLSKWLLSEINVAQDIETPTFYQSLAGVTHLEERDIIELEKCFWSLRNSAPTGQLDMESLTPLLSPPLPAAAVAGTFLAFDENRDGHVDFKELCCGLSAACRGPKTERIKFCFKIFDLDSDGVLNKKELIDMVGILCTVANEHIKNTSSRASTPDNEAHETTDEMEKGFDPEVILLNLRDKLVTAPKGRKAMFQLGPSAESEDIIVLTETEDEGIISKDTVLTMEDFLIWCVESTETLVAPFLQVLFDVCHVVLGLRPQCRHHERDIVLGWLGREVVRGYSVGQFWYLISAEWWAAWGSHVAAPCCRQRNVPTDEAIVCDESFTTNSTDSVTESMGSLVWRCETASLGSAGSSSGVSSALSSLHPGPIDNCRLRQHDPLQVPTLTGEGGHLRRDVTLSQHRDFELVPAALWRALALWYGAQDPLPRQVIRPPNSDVELELYPLQLKLFRHVPSSRLSVSGAAGVGVGAGAGMYGGVGACAPPERQLAYTAAFSRLATVKQVSEFVCGALGLSRENTRLWSLGAAAVLLDDDRVPLHALRLDGRLLLEIRNPDLTWPEEIAAIRLSGGDRGSARRATLAAPDLPGATGLHNLGNTCFMNAALQSVWNTGPLTKYFNSGMHLYEVNTTNPLGTKGALALRFGELCKEVWSMRSRSVAPLRVRWAVCRHARALAGGGQHDAQELLAWLLDTLHEDLNRACPRSPAAPRDSGGRPDTEVAAEAWAAYSARNHSIITDLFYGQLKSRVRCEVCKTESVRFDAFNMLSLPLPMEAFLTITIKVILLDGSIPIKYGVRLNSEGTYAELKKKLSELCGLEPDSILIVTLNGSLVGNVMSDYSRVSSNVDLTAYQLPIKHDSNDGHAHTLQNGWCPGEAGGGGGGGGGGAEGLPHAGAAAEVSGHTHTRGNTAAASLCMPALFCFKRSRSELAMSQSPPALLRAASHPAHYRSNTLPKELKKEDPRSSPTPSTRSLNLSPSPRAGRVQFSPPPPLGGVGRLHDDAAPVGGVHYLVAVHRKQVGADAYFLPWQRTRPAVFGVPLLVGVHPAMSGHELYARVWTQVSRLLSARPPQAEGCNHATDCDDSLGYEFPFTLRVVSCSGAWCGACAWPALCRGCAVSADCMHTDLDSESLSSHTSIPAVGTESPIVKAKLQRQASARLASCHEGAVIPGGAGRLQQSVLSAVLRAGRRAALAVDWEPTALHLRYQSTREKACIEHSSVSSSREAAARAVDVVSCLRAFTRPESLEQPYHCSECRALRPATKTLQIWRLPSVLIIHLKRFQYVNNKWIKSQKVVNFPFEDFDPTDYLASVPQETILRHRELSLKRRSIFMDEISESEDEEDEIIDIPKEKPKVDKVERRRKSIDEKRRERLESTSLMNTPVTDDNLVDFHQHPLLKDQDPFDLKYNLYAVVSHSGQLSGGHYVAYARNPAGAWLCYNDSMCRALPPAHIDPAAAYLLFYERRGLDAERFLPDVTGRAPPPDPGPDPDENKACVIQ